MMLDQHIGNIVLSRHESAEHLHSHHVASLVAELCLDRLL